MKSEEKELLEQAKLRYPPGTVFNSTGGWENCVVPQNFKFDCNGDYSDIKIVTILADDLIGRIYTKGIWAEIISKPSTITKQQKQDIIKMIKEI